MTVNSQNSLKPEEEPIRVNFAVFLSSASVILVLAFMIVLYPSASQKWLNHAQLWVADMFGWYYMLLMVVCMVFVFWLALSRFGQLKLGHEDEKPQFGYASWVAMLFSAGIGIALVYYGAYEPLDHFLQPPEGQGGTVEAARQAMAITFLHWGLHGWALYALIATALAWFAYRRDLPLALRSALYPLFGKRIHGWIGHLVDSFGILVTVISMVTNLGIGALLVNSGLNYLFHIPQNIHVLMILIVVMMIVATLAAVTGVEKGIAMLSNINVGFLCLLLLFVFVAGPTMTLVNGMMQNVGDYLTSIVGKSFDLYLYGKARQWQGAWTLFYWAWWVAWAPFVGLFIARISKGRTIRELIFGVLLIPLGFTLAWLSLFGNTAISLVLEGGHAILGEIALSDPPMAVFKMFEYLPFTQVVAGFTILISFVLFLTPVDSGTLMIANLSSKGGSVNDDAPAWLRIFWACVTTLVCAGLLYAGSFSAMQTAVVLCGLPFSIVIVLYMASLYKDLHQMAPAELAAAMNQKNSSTQ
ncbi:choline/glycine/proline betaine transport protein [Candidatus Pantoea symbiotica]|jgi:choline/glycine/proline betaine transport protein|uniref:Choline/glycine/proline betaine transport protein n=1 Tax=Candidatus Pantoea symbiotica TaxID=1884370 RepID=A0A1I3YSX4_9GAMM|nr:MULTISPECIES: BCCT family transporter [Pantoea]KAJ9430527.1 BCCT family transporter [Pantoea sp. YR343]SFK34964.1 choline/glycine/proline betaine transport protein [Pantoea symbiotica]SFU87266.1 choline/glycine/proline betaine transport protein [Pantoea sp. YR525]